MRMLSRLSRRTVTATALWALLCGALTVTAPAVPAAASPAAARNGKP
ncbi:hypothetical protein JGS39_27520 [Streptomyces sp. P01-B04]|nr:hypothetical protein [Streptomyces poriferorum]MBW5252693.1 hypothetical protein [Streptomyces poriferorum]